LFELFEVGDEPLPPFSAQTTQRLRPPVFESLPHFNESGFAQHVEMPAQIAIGQRTQPLQLGEEHSLRSSHERCHDPEPRLLVKNTVEALVCKTTGLVGVDFLLVGHNGNPGGPRPPCIAGR